MAAQANTRLDTITFRQKSTTDKKNYRINYFVNFSVICVIYYCNQYQWLKRDGSVYYQ